MPHNNKNEVLYHALIGALVSLFVLFILGNFYSCFIYRYLHKSSNSTVNKLASDFRKLFGDVGVCYSDVTKCDDFKVANPSREQVFNALSKLRQINENNGIAIDMENCPFVIIGITNNAEQQEPYYVLSIADVNSILNEYQIGNTNYEVRLIVLDRESKKRILLDSLQIDAVVPTLVNSINKGYYTITNI